MSEIYAPKHRAVIDCGLPRFLNLPFFKRWCCGEFREGEPVEVIVRRVQKIRPEWMRLYYFGYIVDPLAKDHGYTIPDMHEILKKKHAWVPEFPEIHEVQSTTRMTTERHWEYIDEIISHWTGKGFVIPEYEQASSLSRMMGGVL